MPNLPNECIVEQVNVMNVDDSELTIDGMSSEVSCTSVCDNGILFIVYYLLY